MIDEEELKHFELLYFQNGYNVPYALKKGGEILIKPILVKDYSMYEWAKQILEIKKNEINDIRVIQMSYLEFLIECIIGQQKELGEQLFTLLNLTLCEDNIKVVQDKGKDCIIICETNDDVKYVISSKEFDDISKIVLNQNDANYDNRYITPEVQEMMQEFYKVKYKDVSSPSLEKRKSFVSSKTGILTKDLNNITCREFDNIYHANVDSEIYIGQKIIQASEKYKVEEDIKHPLFEKKKDPYAEIFEDTSILSGKGINGAEKLAQMQ